MYTVFLWYAALMICLNISFLYVDSVVDIPLLNPFDLTEVQMGSLPNINNGTGSVLNNVTTSVTNSTSGNPFSFLTDSLFYSLQLLWNFLGFLVSGYVFGVMYSFGMPTFFVNLFVLGIVSFFAILTAIHFWTGRI